RRAPAMLPKILSRKISSALLFVLFLAVAFSTAKHASAQVVGATLSGTVTDPSGAAIANSQVSITNRATGVTREITTDSAGFYSVPNLLPASYDVIVAAKGFSTAKQSDVTLTVGAQQVLNIAMRLGEATQTIEVAAVAPMVQLGSS